MNHSIIHVKHEIFNVICSFLYIINILNWTTYFGKKVAHVFLVEDSWSQCLVNGCGSLQSMFHNVIFVYIEGRWVLWV